MAESGNVIRFPAPRRGQGRPCAAARAAPNRPDSASRAEPLRPGDSVWLERRGCRAVVERIDGPRLMLRLLNGRGLAVARLSEVSRKLFASPREGLLAHKRVLRSIAQVADGAPRAVTAYGMAVAWGEGGVLLDRAAAQVLAEAGRALL